MCVKEAERRRWGGREGDGSMSYGVCVSKALRRHAEGAQRS